MYESNCPTVVCLFLILVLVKHPIPVLGSPFSLVTAYSANQLSMEPFVSVDKDYCGLYSTPQSLWNKHALGSDGLKFSAATTRWVLPFLFPSHA